MGHPITATRPLSHRATHLGTLTAYRVNGTPADCVALGAYHWGKVDVVLSGINLGLNLGNSIWHSGTLASAKQAALLGVPGIALSGAAGVEYFESSKPWILAAAFSPPRSSTEATESVRGDEATTPMPAQGSQSEPSPRGQ
jgi:5'-nucleotidase